MLIKNSVLLLIGLSFSQASFATELKSTSNLKASATVLSGQDLPRPLPTEDTPTPVTFDFCDGKKVFDRGLLPTEQGLVGSWLVVGYASVSRNFTDLRDFYVADGMANHDGTKWSVVFGWHVKEITNEKYFSAKFLNWAGDNQGPYQARIDKDRKAAITAFFANGGRSKTIFTFDCRQVNNNSDLAVCGVTLKLNGNNTTPAQKQYDNVMGGMLVLKKSR